MKMVLFTAAAAAVVAVCIALRRQITAVAEDILQEFTKHAGGGSHRGPGQEKEADR